MDKKLVAKEVINSLNGIAKASQLFDAGLSKTDVCKLANEGYLIRVKHGYYSLSNGADVPEEQIIKTTLPETVVCVESALFRYGYSDFAPRIWSLAVPRSMTRTKLKSDVVLFKPYYIRNELINLGKTTEKFNDVELPIYDRERTICDCFKYRTKLDNELFNKAVNAYVSDKEKNLSNLSEYAKKMRIHKKVMESMEVLLNG